MSCLKELLLCLVPLFSSVLPVLPQQCDQFDIQPPLGPDMPLILVEGTSRTLSCSHRTIPAFAVDWYRDTTALREDIAGGNVDCSCNVPSVDPQDQSITVKELIFTDFAASSAGEYSCRVPLGLGVFNICRFAVEVAEAPSFQDPQPPSSRTVIEGGTLTFTATVDGRPTPTITWRNGSTELTNGGRVDISDTGSLTVNNIMHYDRGNYSLNLTNIAGTLVMNFSVFVPFVEITSITRPRVTSDGMEIEVTCEAIGYPGAAVEWQDPSNNVIAGIDTFSSGGTYEHTFRGTLTINQRDCQGPYFCSANNAVSGAFRRTRTRSVDACNMPPPPPQPMNVMAIQDSSDSVRVSWTVERPATGTPFMIDVCYTVNAVEICLPRDSLLPNTTGYTTVNGLDIGVNYNFVVVSVTAFDSTESVSTSVTLSPCLGAVNVQVFGVSVVTTVNEGERTFNISWREAQSDNNVRGYKVLERKRGWASMVTARVITNIVTPANFCNGEDHTFVVMAINNCGSQGPPSAPVIGKCETVNRIRISDVTSYGTALTVKWTLKQSSTSSYTLQSPLSITVLEIKLGNSGQQLLLNYSTNSIVDEAECLGDLSPSTAYKVCLHPSYSDNFTEPAPVCMDVTTNNMDEPGFDIDSCTKPHSMDFVGSPVEQGNRNATAIPDYAIAVIVVGALIIVAFVFCGIGVCFACSNSKSKDIDDIGSEYSSSIAGMQGRMTSNHNRNMSPTRSCLSYHSKGHSTNWNDHMGTLREMETEVGTNV